MYFTPKESMESYIKDNFFTNNKTKLLNTSFVGFGPRINETSFNFQFIIRGN